MHQSLAIGTAAHDKSAVVVLHGTGKNLAGTGTVFVDENDYLGILEPPVALTPRLVAVPFVAAFNRDDGLACRQEFVSHAHGDFHEAAAVAAQVNDVAAGSLALKALHGLDELVECVAPKVGDLEIARVLVNHVVRIDSVHGYVTACDGEGQCLGGTPAFDVQLHFAALGAAQLFGNE